MKHLQGSKFIALLISLIIGALAFVGCENNKLDSIAGPDTQAFSPGQSTLEKTGISISTGTASVTYPQTGTLILRYDKKWGAYMGGQVKLPNGSIFRITNGAITPPAHLAGSNITIEMTVERDTLDNALIYTFGPSGCKFSPSAVIWMKWDDLGKKQPNLYYIEKDGSYTLQQPDQVDQQNHWMMIQVDHFSRYALVHG